MEGSILRHFFCKDDTRRINVPSKLGSESSGYKFSIHEDKLDVARFFSILSSVSRALIGFRTLTEKTKGYLKQE